MCKHRLAEQMQLCTRLSVSVAAVRLTVSGAAVHLTVSGAAVLLVLHQAAVQLAACCAAVHSPASGPVVPPAAAPESLWVVARSGKR
jgi:hypothetical protein